jgi:hypothetical protein
MTILKDKSRLKEMRFIIIKIIIIAYRIVKINILRQKICYKAVTLINKISKGIKQKVLKETVETKQAYY